MSDDNVLKEVVKNRDRIRLYERDFERIFNLRLKDYYGTGLHLVFGFDIFKFADDLSARHIGEPDWCKVESPFSLAEMVHLQYKQEGLDLMEALIAK